MRFLSASGNPGNPEKPLDPPADLLGEPMKVLFVCFANAGRSQVAEALFKRLSRHEAESAGTRVDALLTKRKPPSNMIKHATGGQAVIAYMKGEGIDPSENMRKQLNLEVVENADKVIVITSKESWPEYLLESSKVTFWDIPNAVEMSPEAARLIYDRVRQRVNALVDEIG